MKRKALSVTGCPKEDCMKKVLIIAVMLGLAVSTSAFSQTPNPANQKSLLALKELFQQLRDYAQANIIPKMKELKTKLDNSMSPDDLQSLNKTRVNGNMYIQKNLKNNAVIRVGKTELKFRWDGINEALLNEDDDIPVPEDDSALNE